MSQHHPFETSSFVSPRVLAIIRISICLYIFASILIIWVYEATHGKRGDIGQSFSYFTWLTYWGLGFYFFVASIHSAVYARTGRSWLFDRLPRLLVLHHLFYASVTTFPFLVSLVFWAVLLRGALSPFGIWMNVSQHCLNSVFALLEIVLATTQPHPLVHLLVLVAILVLYLGVAYLTHQTEHFYPYYFLGPGAHGQKRGDVVAYLFGICAVFLFIFAGSWGAIWLRRKLARSAVRLSPRDPAQPGAVSGSLNNNLNAADPAAMELAQPLAESKSA